MTTCLKVDIECDAVTATSTACTSHKLALITRVKQTNAEQE